jgi:hypothetical protein
VHGWQGNYLTVYDTGRLGGTASLPSARPTASGITFTPPASTTPASTSAPAATARRRSLTRSPNITRSATPSRTRADTSSSRTRSSTTTRLGSASTHRKATYPRPARHLRREHRSATPTITSTALSRCTIVRGHRIVANNNLSVPSNTSSERPGWGIGIVRLGAYCDLVTKNVLARNRTVGVLGLEFPWSRPARRAPVHFQLAGNRIAERRHRIQNRHRDRGRPLRLQAVDEQLLLKEPLREPRRPPSCGRSAAPTRNRRCRTRARGRRATRSLRADRHVRLSALYRRPSPWRPAEKTNVRTRAPVTALDRVQGAGVVFSRSALNECEPRPSSRSLCPGFGLASRSPPPRAAEQSALRLRLNLFHALARQPEPWSDLDPPNPGRISALSRCQRVG